MLQVLLQPGHRLLCLDSHVRHLHGQRVASAGHCGLQCPRVALRVALPWYACLHLHHGAVHLPQLPPQPGIRPHRHVRVREVRHEDARLRA